MNQNGSSTPQNRIDLYTQALSEMRELEKNLDLLVEALHVLKVNNIAVDSVLASIDTFERELTDLRQHLRQERLGAGKSMAAPGSRNGDYL